jgi:Domain of unknown function (DUF5916)/Carbohydrate family 9 binding domain-like
LSGEKCPSNREKEHPAGKGVNSFNSFVFKRLFSTIHPNYFLRPYDNSIFAAHYRLMLLRNCLITLSLFLISLHSLGQDQAAPQLKVSGNVDNQGNTKEGVQVLQAIKVSPSPKIDANPADAAWDKVPAATSFTTTTPVFGNPISQATSVKVTYDNTAVYVLAYLYDDPKLIRKQLTQRDREERQDVDYFSVAFDTYNDNQNAFQFLVTSANVQSDIRISSTSDGRGFDYNWDAVWESKVSMKEDGWVVEMKIPFSALRFSKKSIQDWGMQLTRYIRRTNESANWSPVNPQVNGFVNQFGDLAGLENLSPPLRLSFLPYISAGYRSSPNGSGGFQTQLLRSGGMDVKYGINESFTLDMTLIPDFGQVQSDRLVLNLTPFEIQFQENRPFFTEGTELFTKSGIFYSRRVGGTPNGFYDAVSLLQSSPDSELLSNPSATQLLNATKVSGRTKGNLGIGFFNAVTAPMFAEFRNTVTGDKTRFETEPLTNYNIFVLDQVFKNRSSITFTNTNVTRSGKARDANVSALDISIFDKKNTYNFTVKGRFSSITGMERYNGFRTSVNFAKVSGSWQYEFGNNIESENYDPNDLGILQAPNGVSSYASVRYQIFKPVKNLLNQSYSVGVNYNTLYKPNKFQDLEFGGNIFLLFKNFWDISIELNTKPIWYNDYFFYTNNYTGKVLKRTPYYFMGLFGSTDSRKKLFGRYQLGFAESPLPNDPFYFVELGARYRFSDRFSVDMSAREEADRGNWGYSLWDEVKNEPIIARRNVKQVTTTLGAIYNFTPRMNMTLRGRHYWSKVQNTNFYDLRKDGYWDERAFINGQDRSYNAFNIDMFYTWDFKLGSRLIFAWKNSLGGGEFFNPTNYGSYGKNFSRVFAVQHFNELSIKFVYFVDYLHLKRKKA